MELGKGLEYIRRQKEKNIWLEMEGWFLLADKQAYCGAILLLLHTRTCHMMMKQAGIFFLS